MTGEQQAFVEHLQQHGGFDEIDKAARVLGWTPFAASKVAWDLYFLGVVAPVTSGIGMIVQLTPEYEHGSKAARPETT